MKNWKYLRLLPAALVTLSIVFALSAHSKAQPPTSAESSPKPATRANDPNVVNACAAAVEELLASHKLIGSLEKENKALRERLETAARADVLLNELNETRRSENEALRFTIAAKNETIAAKDAAISKQEELITELRRRKSSPWKRVGDILIGVAVSAILK